MVCGRLFCSSALCLIFLCTTVLISALKPGGEVLKASSLLVGSGFNTRVYPSRNSGWPRHLRVPSLPPTLKLQLGLQITHVVLDAFFLILLSGDVKRRSRYLCIM